MICKKCGHENSDIKRCCESCGSILEGWTINNTTGKYGYRTSAGEFLPSDKAKEKEKLLDDFNCLIINNVFNNNVSL